MRAGKKHRRVVAVFVMLSALAASCDFLVPGLDQQGRIIQVGNLDAGHAVVATDDGGFLVAGHTGFNGYSDSLSFDRFSDVLLLKTGSNGKERWHKTYSFGYAETAHSIVRTADQGYAVAGTVEKATPANYSDAFLMKTDDDGQVQWTATFDAGNEDRAFAVVQDDDGGFVVAGSTSADAAPYRHVLLLNYSASGTLRWSAVLADTVAQEAFDVAVVADGYLLTGATQRTADANDTDILLLKVDRNGRRLWARAYGGTQFDEGRTLLVEPDGYVLGATRTDDTYFDSHDGYDSFAAILKTDLEGTLRWSKSLGGDRLYALARAGAGGYLAAGYDFDDGGGPYGRSTYGNAYLARADAAGDLVSGKPYHYHRYDYAYAVAETRAGKAALVGESRLDGYASTVSAVYVVVE